MLCSDVRICVVPSLLYISKPFCVTKSPCLPMQMFFPHPLRYAEYTNLPRELVDQLAHCCVCGFCRQLEARSSHIPSRSGSNSSSKQRSECIR